LQVLNHGRHHHARQVGFRARLRLLLKLLVEPARDVPAAGRHDLDRLVQVEVEKRVDNIIESPGARDGLDHLLFGEETRAPRVDTYQLAHAQLSQLPFERARSRSRVDVHVVLPERVDGEQGGVGLGRRDEDVRARFEVEFAEHAVGRLRADGEGGRHAVGHLVGYLNQLVLGSR
jgi:hypothetical protein